MDNGCLFWSTSASASSSLIFVFIGGDWPGLYQPPLRFPLCWYLCLLVAIGRGDINLRFGFLFVDICVYWWGLAGVISTSASVSSLLIFVFIGWEWLFFLSTSASASSSLIFVFIGGDWPGLYQPPLRFPLCWYLCLLVAIGRGYIILRFGFLFVHICVIWRGLAGVISTSASVSSLLIFVFIGGEWLFLLSTSASASSSLIFVFIGGDLAGITSASVRIPLRWYLCLLVGIGRDYINLRFGFLFVDICVYWWRMAVYFDQPPLRLPLRWYLCLLVGI